MSNSDTGINQILKDIGRTPETFRRDTPMLLKTLDGLESLTKRVNDLDKSINELSELPMFKKQAE